MSRYNATKMCFVFVSGGKNEEGEKNGKKKKFQKKKPKLKNGIELENEQQDLEEGGCPNVGITEPDNIREIISKDEATTGSR